jgi:DNA-binding transcriptional ArsR family regulator
MSLNCGLNARSVVEFDAGDRRGARKFRSLTLAYISESCHPFAVHAFDVLGDPVRRRILELLAEGEQSSGAISAVIESEFGISHPRVSQHLRVLRESGFSTVRAHGARRLYALDATPMREVEEWLDRFRQYWDQRLDALATELARGRRARRPATDPTGRKKDDK